MKVILDTNIVFATRKRLLRDVSINTIVAAKEKMPLDLLLPSLVREELIQSIKTTVATHHTSIQRDLRRLKGLLNRPGRGMNLRPSPTPKAAADQYARELDERIRQLDISVPDHAAIPHHLILTRLFAARKPFKPNGDGYRDALIWEVVLAQISGPRDTVVFITNNTKDFADHASDTSTLHPDLRDDVTERGFPEQTVRLCTSLDEFINNYVRPELELLKDLSGRLDDGCTRLFPWRQFFRKKKEMSGKVRVSLSTMDESLSELLEIDLHNPSLTCLWFPPDIPRDVDMRKLDDHSILVSAQIDMEADIEFLIRNVDAHGVPVDHAITVLDSGSSEGVRTAKAKLPLDVRIALILEAETEAIREWDVTSVALRRQPISVAKVTTEG